MKIRNAKGGILRIRPGNLANFSGGAGYMPFIVIYSVIASVLFGILGSLFLHLRGRTFLTAGDGTRTGLHEFVRYARWHTLVCIIIAIVAGVVLFRFGQTMVYGDKAKYALVTAVFAMGPLTAWVLSSFALIRLIVRWGASWTNLLIAAAIHVILLAACILLIMLVSAITGARL